MNAKRKNHRGESNGPRRLTPKELDDLREDMNEASAWARAQLRRRRDPTMSSSQENGGVSTGGGMLRSK